LDPEPIPREPSEKSKLAKKAQPRVVGGGAGARKNIGKLDDKNKRCYALGSGETRGRGYP